MLPNKEIVIQDACVLFDLIDLQLIDLFFELELTVMTTPQVIGEIEEDEQQAVVRKFIDKGKLLIDKDGITSAVQEIYDANRGLSFADCSVLELALRVKGSVLSSDLDLRNVTTRNKLIVRGILWIVKELHLTNRLTGEALTAKLKLYQQINDRAPKKEIKEMIEGVKIKIEAP